MAFLLPVTMKHSAYFTALGCLLGNVQSFQVSRTFQYHQSLASQTCLRSTELQQGSDEIARREEVGNLVADDEWEGLGMELSELVRTAVIEDLKKKSRDFLGKEEYKGMSINIGFLYCH